MTRRPASSATTTRPGVRRQSRLRQRCQPSDQRSRIRRVAVQRQVVGVVGQDLADQIHGTRGGQVGGDHCLTVEDDVTRGQGAGRGGPYTGSERVGHYRPRGRPTGTRSRPPSSGSPIDSDATMAMRQSRRSCGCGGRRHAVRATHRSTVVLRRSAPGRCAWPRAVPRSPGSRRAGWPPPSGAPGPGAA
jgi:hypothetical protein